MKNVMRGFVFAAAAAISLVMAGCGSLGPGGLNGNPDGDPLKRMTYACSDGLCTTNQLMVFAIAATVANDQLIPQFSGRGESMGTGCVAYGAAYGAAGATQGVFYPGALTGAAAGYGLASGCLAGAANGLYTFSYAVDAATGFHTEQILRDWEKGIKIPAAVRARFPNIEDLCAGLHASASYIRTENETPDSVKNGHWTGAPVGSPAS